MDYRKVKRFSGTEQALTLRRCQAVDPAYWKKPKSKKETAIFCSCGCGFEIAPYDEETIDTGYGRARYICAIAKVLKMLKAVGLPEPTSYENQHEFRQYLQGQVVTFLHQTIYDNTCKLLAINEICEFLKLEPVILSALVRQARKNALQ